MNIDKAQKILGTVKKRKLANGKDLTVAIRGAEVLYMIMFQLMVLLFILSNNSHLRENTVILLSVVGVIFTIIIVLAFCHKKVVSVREFMIAKRVYNLDEIEN